MRTLSGFPVVEKEVQGLGPIVFGDFSRYLTPVVWENVKVGDRLHIKFEGKETDVIVNAIDPDGTIRLKTI